MAGQAEPKKIGVRELRGKLSDYLRQVQAGARFTIVSRGKPVAELGAPAEVKPKLEPRRSGRLAGQIWVADDFDTWPEDILESFEKPL